MEDTIRELPDYGHTALGRDMYGTPVLVHIDPRGRYRSTPVYVIVGALTNGTVPADEVRAVAARA